MSIARWAFNIRQPLLLENVEPLVTSLTDDDRPNIVPVSNLLNFLPKGRGDSLLQFRLEDDMRRALVGQLMTNAFFTEHYGCSWGDLVFVSNNKEDGASANTPELVAPEHLQRVSFNISHHGDWVLFVGETSLGSAVRLGVDVMDFQEQAPGESFETFSACFQDQFTPKEIAFMAKAAPDTSLPCTKIENQLKRFYRLWCLKESTVKAIGAGVDFNLKSIEFTIQDEEETVKPIRSTILEVHDPKPELPEEGWSFEEALLDAHHCYAIAALSEMKGNGTIMDGSEVRRFGWTELLKDAVPNPAPCA